MCPRVRDFSADAKSRLHDECINAIQHLQSLHKTPIMPSLFLRLRFYMDLSNMFIYKGLSFVKYANIGSVLKGGTNFRRGPQMS